MSSLKKLFERHSEDQYGITKQNEWRSFEHDITGLGLNTPALARLLTQVWGQNHSKGQAVKYSDLLSAATEFTPDNEADKIIQDLRQDSSALNRFVDFVRGTYKKDSNERLSLEHGK